MLHQPKIIFTLKDLELWKDLASFKKWLNAVHYLHTAAFFLYTLITQDHVFIFQGKKIREPNTFQFCSSTISKEKTNSPHLGETKRNCSLLPKGVTFLRWNQHKSFVCQMDGNYKNLSFQLLVNLNHTLFQLCPSLGMDKKKRCYKI